LEPGGNPGSAGLQGILAKANKKVGWPGEFYFAFKVLCYFQKERTSRNTLTYKIVVDFPQLFAIYCA